MDAVVISKVPQAIETFLNRRSCTVLIADWTYGNDRIDFITEVEDGGVAFITTNVTENTGDGFPAKRLDE